MAYIFLAGVHGAGKSTLLSQVANVMAIEYYSISDLIRLSGEKIDPKDKNTESIDSNQNRWKDELMKIQLNEDKPLILDGHFSLIDANGGIKGLPEDTFSGTDMVKIVLKKEDPEIIQERLLQRDGKLWDISLLAEFSKTEERVAFNYSKNQNLPLFIYSSESKFEELVKFIKSR